MKEFQKDSEVISLKKIIINYMHHWRLFLVICVMSFIPAILYLVLCPKTYEVFSLIRLQEDKDFGGSGGIGFGDAAGLMRSFGIGNKVGVSLNVDDEKYEDLRSISKAKVISYGIDRECDYRAINVVIDSHYSRFDLVYGGKTYKVKTNLVATYNIYNLLASIAALHETGMDLQEIIDQCEHLPQIDGRLEQIDLGQPYHVVVDFAHTPDGMEKIMQFGRQICKDKKLIAVFGSAGKRDIAKRKVFGEIADQYCDLIILTEDDPRDEDPKEIADQIKEGIKSTQNIFIEDRYEAIRQAVENANEGDAILLLGKGDESFIYRENGRAPWIGDNVAVKECIEKYTNQAA